MKIENVQSAFSQYARQQCEGIYDDLRLLTTADVELDDALVADGIRRLHSLAGSAGLIGCIRISIHARKAEHLLVRYETKRHADRLVFKTCRCLGKIVRELDRRSPVCFESRAI